MGNVCCGLDVVCDTWVEYACVCLCIKCDYLLLLLKTSTQFIWHLFAQFYRNENKESERKMKMEETEEAADGVYFV